MPFTSGFAAKRAGIGSRRVAEELKANKLNLLVTTGMTYLSEITGNARYVLRRLTGGFNGLI